MNMKQRTRFSFKTFLRSFHLSSALPYRRVFGSGFSIISIRTTDFSFSEKYAKIPSGAESLNKCFGDLWPNLDSGFIVCFGFYQLHWPVNQISIFLISYSGSQRLLFAIQSIDWRAPPVCLSVALIRLSFLCSMRSNPLLPWKWGELRSSRTRIESFSSSSAAYIPWKIQCSNPGSLILRPILTITLVVTD